MTTKAGHGVLARERRGLTLLEVLAATMMLALLAATCSPIIAKAMVLVSRAPPTPTAPPTPHALLAPSRVTSVELAEVADAFLANPKRFDITEIKLHEIESIEFTCPASFEQERSITATTLAGRRVQGTRLGPPNQGHVWLVFECDRTRVVRWVPLPEEAKAERSAGVKGGVGVGGGRERGGGGGGGGGGSP